MITTSAPNSTETLDNGLISPVNADGLSYGVTIGVSFALLLILMVVAVAVVCYIIWNKSAKKKRENHMDNPQSTTCGPLESLQATGIPESPAAKEAEGNFRRESFVFATDLNTSTVSINVWPGAEEFFRNFHVREEYDFRGIPAGENASRVSEFNRNIEVKVLAEPQNISSDEPSETDPCLAELAFGGTSASIEVKDLEKEMLAKQKLQLIEELKKSQYMERLEYVHKRFLITLIRGGPTVEEIRQDLLSAGFAPEEFSIEYLRNSNFEMAYG
ncbi:hypothetical protein CAPTEDRAFT_219163 [Capitella teleta]|uniref:Uncharacterized protein n=1 Tax=Capitella teleta TaxID=283909 RepID=R7U7J0_CAPTE|nr:hypothetical protein CAPTEDRAFT_219163 [Capitella teleta]|eukprot:ELU02335.1 hypothetical protein CAPTEDRAFT_219163 [Capitella teleta]